ncbi:nonsense-mediated mRNA decay protein 5 [[Candida] jaroonii]|uniref:Nonsense-mediated mRNA decay protein 5 n=1 Tax=[Candida] jaroonii TaxID=467808 RepID=A0ACA9Y0J1_9ASCO|nr:nonsense-mediated mRNA decay protein 5 [[Candida] jaroonii]
MNNSLHQSFQNTLSPDLEIRRKAEYELKELSGVPGFLIGCLSLIEEPNIHNTVKIASAVYFKNQIVSNWNKKDNNVIENEEREYIKRNIIQVMNVNEYHIKQQFVPVIRSLVTYEFPNDWEQLLTNIDALLKVPGNMDISDKELNDIYTGLLILKEIFKKYQWFKNEEREILNSMFEMISNYLINISEILINNSENLTEFSSEILKLILKIFKFLVYFDLPVFLQKSENIENWGLIHYKIINMKLPNYISDFNSEKDKNFLQISKVLKWAYYNINRLFKRYIINKNYKKLTQGDDFRKMFGDNFLPHVIQNLIKIIEMYCLKMKWLNYSSLYYLIEILQNSVSIKRYWNGLKPYLPEILSNFIYPMLISNDERLEIFENDPQEYIQLNFNYFNDDCNNPDAAASNLLKILIEKRKTDCLDIIVGFVFTKFNELHEQDSNDIIVAQQKEGILRMINSIIYQLIQLNDENLSQNLTDFLINKILPNLNSKHEFLIARTYEVISKFSDLNFENEDHLNVIIFNVLKNFQSNQDINLVVLLENSLAIQSYLHLNEFKQHLSTMILPVMSKLLEINNKIDNDTISVVMQECVENFGQQLQPFGIELIYKLVENFMEISNEIAELTESSSNNNDEINDKIIIGIGNLNTIITVLLTFENNDSMIKKLTEILNPIIENILVKKDSNFFTEMSEILENLIYLNKSSNSFLRFLQLILDIFEIDNGINYFEDFLPVLKNFLIYSNNLPSDSFDIFSNIFLKIFKLVIDNNNVGTGEFNLNQNDLIFDFELIQYFILNFKLKSMEYFKVILNDLILPIFENFESYNSSYKINLINVLVCILIYDANLIALYEFFPFFIENWIKFIPKLTRVYDIKLSILGLISLINNVNNFTIINFNKNFNLNNNLLFLIKKLPTSVTELNKKRQLFNSFEINSKNEMFDNTENEDDDDDEDEEDDEFENDQTEYLKFLTEENFKLTNFDDDLVEDPLEVTPLDNINLKEILHNFVNLLQIKNLEKFRLLFGEIPFDELNNCINLI